MAVNIRSDARVTGFTKLDDADARVSNGHYTYFSFDDGDELPKSKSPEDVENVSVVFAFNLVPIADPNSDGVREIRTVGTNLVPSQDGETPARSGLYLTPKPEATSTGLRKNTNYARFLDELVDAGFPEDSIPSDSRADFLDGAILHVEQEPIKDTDGNVLKTIGNDGREYDKTRTCVTRIVAGSGDNAVDPDLENALREIILERLKKVEEPVKAARVIDLIFEDIGEAEKSGKIKDARTARKFASSESFLKNPQNPWSYDAETTDVSVDESSTTPF